jgi:hypothetical protein
VTATAADQARTVAEALPAGNAVERENRTRALDRARGMAKVVAKNG